jgi:hypothetical protein
LGILGNPQNHWNLSGQDGEKLGVISTGVVNHKMFGCFVLFCAIYNHFKIAINIFILGIWNAKTFAKLIPV